jgi:hypothetical protein
MIEDLQAAGTRHKVNVVAANFRIGVAVPVEQGKRRRCIRDGLVDDIRGKQNPFAAVICFQSMIL